MTPRTVTETNTSIKPGRKIVGMSAILLPFQPDGSIDWISFDAHVQRTFQAGLIPAVNMDTGYANLIDESTRQTVLNRVAERNPGKPFLAGAFVKDHPSDEFNFDGYAEQMEQIQGYGGIPIVFQSYGLAHQDEPTIVENYRRLANAADRFYAFELGTMFAPFGKIYSLDVFQQLMKIDAIVGAKHSSLERELEWQRLELRDQVRPEFQVLTGNDLAIDMVMYGSDYLLGLSTFCPDLFAIRDRYWEQNDARFFQLNDVLQYLGFFAFRNPTSGYKHNAAMFLAGRDWINSDLTHPESVHRPKEDYSVLYEIGQCLGLEMRAP